MLERVLRPEPGDQRRTQAGELFGIRTRKKSAPCPKPMREGVAAAFRFALGCSRAAAALRVQTVRFDLAVAGQGSANRFRNNVSLSGNATFYLSIRSEGHCGMQPQTTTLHGPRRKR